MPNFDFQNADDFAKFLALSKDKQAEVLSAMTGSVPKPPADPSKATDALGNRDVVSQAISASKAASSSHAGPPLAPRKPALLTGASSADARNALRLANGLDDPFTDVTNYGVNTYVPDFSVNHRLLSTGNQIIMSNKRFYDQSTFFHPILSHIYLGMLEIVLTMRSMREVNRLGFESSQFLNWFDDQFNLDTLPIPGFLRNNLICLGSSSPATADYSNVSPWLPDAPRASDASLGMFYGATLATGSGYNSRIPPLPVLIDQAIVFFEYCITPIAAGQLPTPQNVSQYANFFEMVQTVRVLSAPAAGASFTPFDRRNLNNASLLIVPRVQTMTAPGVFDVQWCPTTVSQTLLSYAQQFYSTLPARRQGVANATYSWRQFCGLDTEFEWFRDLIGVMTLYSEFWNDSCTISEIPPAGSSAGQVEFRLTQGAAPNVTTRYPRINTMFRGELRNYAIPPADRMDAAVSVFNVDAMFVSADIQPRTGPFFANLPVVRRTRDLTPTSGFARVLTDKYRKSNTAN